MRKLLLVVGLITAFAVQPVFAGEKAYSSSWSYNKRTKTWKKKATKPESTLELIERINKKTWKNYDSPRKNRKK